MRLEQTFEVRASVQEVWEALIDIERVAPCLPGAEITQRDEDGTYRGDFKVKLGPTTAAYRGTLKMESLDADAHVATMRANGQDKRGQGSAKATIVSRMSETAGVTSVEVETDFAITGKLARFGRGGMIEDISSKLLGQFATCLQAGFADDDGPADRPAAVLDQAPPSEPPTGAAPPPSASPAPDAPRRFSPPPASEPIGGFGLASSVALDRARPLILALVRTMRRSLERLEHRLSRTTS